MEERRLFFGIPRVPLGGGCAATRSALRRDPSAGAGGAAGLCPCLLLAPLLPRVRNPGTDEESRNGGKGFTPLIRQQKIRVVKRNLHRGRARNKSRSAPRGWWCSLVSPTSLACPNAASQRLPGASESWGGKEKPKFLLWFLSEGRDGKCHQGYSVLSGLEWPCQKVAGSESSSRRWKGSKFSHQTPFLQAFRRRLPETA